MKVRGAVAPWRGASWLDRSERYTGTASQVSRMCGGVCGPRDRHRDLFADSHVPAGDACGVVRLLSVTTASRKWPKFAAIILDRSKGSGV